MVSTSSTTALFYQTVIFLQRLNTTLTTITIFYRLDTLYRSQSPGNSRDIAYLILQTSLAYRLPVLSVVSLSLRCVDYQTNFLVHNHIYYVWAAGTNLVYHIALDSVRVVEVSRALCANQSESEILQSLSDFENLILLAFLVAEGNKNLLVFLGSRRVWKF